MNLLKLWCKWTRSTESNNPSPLPPELWILIFEYVSASDLSQARLVCRYWNQLIRRSSSLAVKFELKLLEKTNSDSVRKLAASSTICFSRVLLHGDAGTWWPQIGQNLQVLEMWNREMHVADLLGLLRETPKLKVLKFCCKYTAGCEIVPQIDFVLASLVVLEIRLNYQLNVLHIFKQVCLRLKQFALDLPDRPGDNEIATSDVIDFVRTFKNSLERVSVLGTDGTLMEELLNVEGFHLKQVTVTSYCPDLLEKVSRMLPSLEKLHSCFQSDMVLCTVGKHLPNLKSLCNRFWEGQPTTVSFLTFMKNLKSLELNCGHSLNKEERLNFADSQHFQLERLALKHAKETLRWIEHFPNLRTLILESCTVESWSGFLTVIGQLKHLQSVKLDYIDEISIRKLHVLHRMAIVNLEVSTCDISRGVLLALISACPNLVKLKLENLQIIDNETMQEICKGATGLKSLELYSCAHLTNTAIDYVCQHCQGLEEIVLHWCRKMSPNVVEKLQGGSIRKVQWNPAIYFA